MKEKARVSEALGRCLEFLERERIDYALLGGLAVRILALPRNTFDIDLLIGVGADGGGA